MADVVGEEAACISSCQERGSVEGHLSSKEARDTGEQRQQVLVEESNGEVEAAEKKNLSSGQQEQHLLYSSPKEVDVDELAESTRILEEQQQSARGGVIDPKSSSSSSSSAVTIPAPSTSNNQSNTATSNSIEKDNTETLRAVSVAIRRSRKEQQQQQAAPGATMIQSTATMTSTKKDNMETLQAVSVAMRLSEDRALRLPGAVHVRVGEEEEEDDDIEAPRISNTNEVAEEEAEGTNHQENNNGNNNNNNNNNNVVVTPGEQQVFHPAELVTAAEMQCVEATPIVHPVPTPTNSKDDSITTDLTPDQQQQQQQQGPNDYRAVRLCILIITGILLVGICILTPVYLLPVNDKNSSNNRTPPPPIPQHCVQPDVKRPPFLEPPDLDPYVRDDIKNPCTPQAWANEWMWDDPNLNNYTLARRIQRFMAASSFLATGGKDYWIRNDSWLSYDIPECQWYYKHPNKDVVCDENNVLRILNLTNNGLRGEITNEMLIYLRTKVVDCSHNNLFGTIPKATQEVGVVEYLDFSHNNLEGEFALEVGVREVSVKVLKIQNNHFGGTLPPDVALMPNLTYIDASNNQFEDRFPLSVGFLQKLEVIRAANNKLYGTIPKGIGRVPKLRQLDISGNIKIEGPLPSELADIDTLEYLDVRNTSITGPIPSRLCDKASSGRLDLWVSGCGSNGWKDCCPS